MNDIKQVLGQGFKLDVEVNSDINLALISLKIALKAFFSTYKSFSSRIRVLKDDGDHNEEDVVYNHRSAYCEAYAECIVHFQHFAELACKSFLRADHPLLAETVHKNPKILYKLVHNEKLTLEEEQKLYSAEFSEAVSRLKVLVQSKQIKGHEELAFIVKHYDLLTELNALRNRIWHRGLYVLKYAALDEFVGKYVLPFVVDTLNHPQYKGEEINWKHKPLACGLDPIDEIIKHLATEKYDIGKLALFKELGRSAYFSKLSPVAGNAPKKSGSFNFLIENIHKARAERIARKEAEHEFNSVTDCPTCGAQALIVYHETDYDNDDETDEPMNYRQYTHRVQCESCSFSLEDAISNASTYGISGIKDFFTSDHL